MADPKTSAWTIRAIWIVFVVTSMPIISDYVRHVLSHSWTWYAVIFAALAVASVWRSERRAAALPLALLLISLGIALEIFSSASGKLRLGRIGFLLAASGLLALEGRLSLEKFFLMALAIPIPHTLLEMIGRPFLFLNIEMLTRTLHAWSVPALTTLRGVERPEGLVFFAASDAGWTSAIFGLGLAAVLLSGRDRFWPPNLFNWGLGFLAGFAVHWLCTTILFALALPPAIVGMRVWRDGISIILITAVVAGVWHLSRRRTLTA